MWIKINQEERIKYNCRSFYIKWWHLDNTWVKCLSCLDDLNIIWKVAKFWWFGLTFWGLYYYSARIIYTTISNTSIICNMYYYIFWPTPRLVIWYDLKWYDMIDICLLNSGSVKVSQPQLLKLLVSHTVPQK